MSRIIFHIDVNSAFLSWTALELLEKGETEKAKSLQLAYLDLIQKLFIEVNPIPIKEAMNLLGYNVGNTRLPLTNMSKKNIDLLYLLNSAIYQKLNEIAIK